MRDAICRMVIVSVTITVALMLTNEQAVAKKRFGFNLDYGLVNDVCRDGAEVGVDFWGNTTETYTYHAESSAGILLSPDLTLSVSNGVSGAFTSVLRRLDFTEMLQPGTTVVIVVQRNSTGQTMGYYPFIVQDCSLASSIAYQGRLNDANQPAQGVYDFALRLFDSETGGEQVGKAVERFGVSVDDGVFELMLDFGHKVFDGNAKWVEIAVRRSGSDQFTVLTPRQHILPAPYALYAANIPPHEHSGDIWEGSKRLTIIGGGLDIHSRYGESRIVIGNKYDARGRNDALAPAIDVEANSFETPVNVRNSKGAAIQASSTYTSGYGSTVLIVNGGYGSAVEVASNTTGIGYPTIYAANGAATGYAGRFIGNVAINGTLSKSAGSFKIDHPLDPANKYLNHSFVESPDMMNIYNGNTVLDANGEAVVTLPAWFEPLNREFRYQLTPIGGPGPNLYIAQEIGGSQFKIAGGAPGLKVSWQVTGIRQDPYAEANRIMVEELKPAEEQGTYLYPQLYGMPEQYGAGFIEAQRRNAAVNLNMQEQASDEPVQ